MASEIYRTRLHAPAKDESKPAERDVLYPETDMESVVTRADGTTLKEDIGHKIVVSHSTDVPPNEKPGVSGRPVLFIRNNLSDAPDYVVG